MTTTAANLATELTRIRRLYAIQIVSTNDCQDDAQTRARLRADALKADILSAEGLIKTGHFEEAYRFLMRRGM